MRNSLTSMVLALVAAACATPGERTAIGAGGGAAAGAGVGALVGGWKGAAIGAAVGGLAGGAVGNYLDKQADELKQVAETTRRTKDGILVDLKSQLLFTSDSAVLKPQAVELVAKLGDILAKYPEDRIKVSGFTDSTGSVAHNEELSLRRARSVRDVLHDRGVKTEQILVEGLGPDRPIATNKTAAGRAQNRRVEIHIDVPDQVAQQ
ncbi:MAG TPA: OmpA family protein [Myxococcales bacterium]|nr:OmpA family protein [Myxococcales bacterium]